MRRRALRALATTVAAWQTAPTLRAHLTTLAGATVTSVGVALVYLPAGVIVGGLALVLYGVEFVDVPLGPAGRKRKG